MTNGPAADRRTRADILEELRETAAAYTGEWDPVADDVGTTLLRIFAGFEHDVIRRLEDVPRKHRLAFYDALGFARRPPRPARVPLTFTTIDDIDDNVVVPGGTQAIATVEDGTTVFEIHRDDGFEATPAGLDAVYSVDPDTDTIVQHSPELNRGEDLTFFSGEDVQAHAVYLGHGDLLNLESGSTIEIRIRTNAPAGLLTADEGVIWEYYGEARDGTVGWHPLSRTTVREPDRRSAPAIPLADQRRLATERGRGFSVPEAFGWETGTVEYAFTVPGPLEETTVADIQSRWIRGRARPGDPLPFSVIVESISLTVEHGSGDGGLLPETALANDVPLDIDADADADIFPFGRLPQPPTTVYLASEEVFTKRGATIAVRFTPPEGSPAPASGPAPDGGTDENGNGYRTEPDDDEEGDAGPRRTIATGGGALAGSPEISWEYWNGNGWSRLRLTEDGTDAFTRPGTVRFVIPDNLTQTAVSGHEGYWIRARLVGGSYGQFRYEITEEGGMGGLVERPQPPRFSGITLGYDQHGEPFEQVVTDNNRSARVIARSGTYASFTPFRELPEADQTVYLGFSDRLHGGPIPLYMTVRDIAYPGSFDPGLLWEHRPASRRDRWAKLAVQDGTAGLTERGIVALTIPGETAASERFGEEKHWIRMRVTGDAFEPNHLAGADAEAIQDGVALPPPILGGIHPNTQWAQNVRTIKREVLGSSDGTADQAFACAHTPVTEIEVWVDEVLTLSSSEQGELLEARPEDVERIPETALDPVEFWVRWTEVPDHLDSDEADRHYTVDRTTGTVRFGDGHHGMNPPTGDDNIRVSYTAAGEFEGAVEPGAIDELANPIALIDSVTNLEASEAGADVESIETAVTRARHRIRHRGRAVTATDFEHVVRAETTELAKVASLPERDVAGRRRPGWVTLLVVPQKARERPAPSVELKERLRTALRQRAPATLTGDDAPRILVRGPDYVEIRVETTIGSTGSASVSTLKEAVESALAAFFHPLVGGPNGTGWDFGETPRPQTVAEVVRGVEGVEAIVDLIMAVSTPEETIRIGEMDRPPRLAPDALVCSGTHEVTVDMTGRE